MSKSSIRQYGLGMALGGTYGGLSGFLNSKKTKLKDKKKSKERRMAAIKNTVVGALLGAGLGAYTTGKFRQGKYKALKSNRKFRDYLSSYSKSQEEFYRRSQKDYQQYYKGYSKGSFKDPFAVSADIKKSKEFFGLQGIKTKKEAKSKINSMIKKYHPDLGGSEEKMKEVNKYKTIFENSDDFQKLSYYNFMLEKKSSYYINENFIKGFLSRF